MSELEMRLFLMSLFVSNLPENFMASLIDCVMTSARAHVRMHAQYIGRVQLSSFSLL